MTTTETKPQKIAAGVMGVWLGLHQLLLADSGLLVLWTLLVLLAGMMLRGFRIFLPASVEWFLLCLTGVFVLLIFTPSIAFYGSVCGLVGAVLLLRTFSPIRGLWVLLCGLAMLSALVLRGEETVNTVFVIVDVAVLMLVAQQLHTPEEAVVKVWESVVRLLRVVLPVTLVVVLAFWIFPVLSTRTGGAWMGFSDGDVLNPGDFGELRVSRRVAFVADFSRSQSVPGWSALYWRGQVLEKNEGLRWSLEPSRINSVPPVGRLPSSGTFWNYSQRLGTDRILSALERPVSVKVLREGRQTTILETGASIFAVLGNGGVELEIVSTSVPADDFPRQEVAEGDLAVPEKMRNDPRLQVLTSGLFVPGASLSAHLGSLGSFFETGGFSYTLRPGQMASHDVAGFLTDRKRGFCEHYAAAAAGLLRMGGIPARIVTGFRGGSWNPWLRTITVRDSDAHAWVEAWDERGRHWIRFDPTTFVAPDFSRRLETDMEPSRWPWHRLAATYASTVLARAGERLASFFSIFTGWEFFLILAVGGGVVFWWRRFRRVPGTDVALACLDRLDKLAGLAKRGRLPGETPLAWFGRLAQSSPDAPGLAEFARSYGRWMYSPDGKNAETLRALKISSGKLGRFFRKNR